MTLTKAEKNQCEEIIYHHAWGFVGHTPAHAVENATEMTLALAKVLNVPMTETFARFTAIKALKKFQYKPPFIVRLFSFIPIPIPIPMQHIIVQMFETTGWKIAEDFTNQRG